MAAACGASGPRPLAFGAEACTQCHMTLIDPRFAAELVTTGGRGIPFDDAGCLATYIATGGLPSERIASLWVTDYLEPDSLLAVEQAVFLRSDALRTPMDHQVVALRPGPAADSLHRRLGGELVSWAAVLRGVSPPAAR